MSNEKLYDVIKKPLITEKSVTATENGQYTFEVKQDANKIEKNTIETGSFAGICATNCIGTISNNSVIGCTGNALLTQGEETAVASFTINNNILQTSSETDYDIMLNVNSQNCVIKDNIYGTRGFKAAKTNTSYILTEANGLINISDTWYYVQDGKMQTDYTGLVKHGGSWYYVQKGILKWGVETLVKYNGTW